MEKYFAESKDKERIAMLHFKTGHRKAVILAHGFYNAKDAFLFRAMAKILAVDYDVISFDFRGHGESSGRFTWTARECADLEAVIGYVKSCGYDAIGLMGFSLGAAISLVETSQNLDIKTLISISAPYDFWKINYHFWKPGMWDDFRLNLGYKAKGKGVRPSHPWETKIAPIDIVARISPRPILFIHGDQDWLINVNHSRKLYEAAMQPKKLVILENGGHAETMFDQQQELLMKYCLEWLGETL